MELSKVAKPLIHNSILSRGRGSVEGSITCYTLHMLLTILGRCYLPLLCMTKTNPEI